MSIFVNVLGWSGAVAVLVAYWLASSGRVEARSYTFQWINLYGAAGLMAVSVYYRVLPNVFLNAAWAAIGVAAICSIWKQHREWLGHPRKGSLCPRCETFHVQNGIGCPTVPVDKW